MVSGAAGAGAGILPPHAARKETSRIKLGHKRMKKPPWQKIGRATKNHPRGHFHTRISTPPTVATFDSS